MHIPLMISGPGIEPGRTDAPARGIDVGPTLLGLAQLERIEGMLGLNLLEMEPKPDRIRVFETYGGAVPQIPGAEALLAGRPPMRQGATVEGWKLILHDGAAELYYLPDDPMEEEDLAEEHPERVEQLRTHITEWESLAPQGRVEDSELSEEDIRALEAGGYL
jgi:arylsulfatase A-like enzyme